jgi:large conductance mechanosensitive channel
MRSRLDGEGAVIREFKEFISRGNLVDLAIAFVLGVAFAAVVTAFTDMVLGTISYIVGGEVSFDELGVHRGTGVVIPYGAFLTAAVNFVLVAFVLFLVVKAYNRFRESTEAGPTEVELLTQIRDELRSRG